MQTKELDTPTKVIRVLTTPLGSRVMRPHFGSRLYELIDRTYDSSYRLDAVAWSAEAVQTNLPELTIRRVDTQKGAVRMLIEDTNTTEEVRVVFA